jgi:hypothetical protein
MAKATTPITDLQTQLTECRNAISAIMQAVEDRNDMVRRISSNAREETINDNEKLAILYEDKKRILYEMLAGNGADTAIEATVAKDTTSALTRANEKLAAIEAAKLAEIKADQDAQNAWIEKAAADAAAAEAKAATESADGDADV